jgi:hypothetical protein
MRAEIRQDCRYPGALEVRMRLSELPSPVAKFLDALPAGDWASAAAQCEPNARVRLSPDPGKARISSWVAGLVSDGSLLLRPLCARERAGAVVVVTLIPQYFGTIILDAPREYEWSFGLRAEHIRHLTVSPRRTPRFDGVVADFICAMNLLDLGALLATFAPEARLVSRGHEYQGHEAIQGWADLRVIGRRLTACVQQVRHRPPFRTRLRCICDGDFDRRGLADPVVTDFYFQLQDAHITELVIEPLTDTLV